MKKEILNISKHIFNNNNNQALIELDKLIAFKSEYPNCCSSCSGYGWNGSTECKKYSPQSWYTLLPVFREFLIDHINGGIDKDYKLKFPVFKKGNGKLPFLNYSTIPVVNCPGAGACATENYCYSLKSLRFPKSTLSWLQNQILENHYFDLIELELEKYLKSNHKKQLKNNLNIDFRLYNDGDFSTLNNMVLWFNLLKKYPNLKTYGYTKSLHLVKELTLTGYEFPNNYRFNISSGSKYEYLKNDNILKNNPCYRGNFIAFDLNGRKISPTKINKNDIKTIRNSFNKKVFICPGLCASCTSIGHACGNSKFDDIDIIVTKH